ncbi:hypothetical protein SISSUDRAFT_1067502 [Sistotremastrum suecicum HHB10207 ss-3]|uniref:Uncharacterized protein n=1 Tax=Sistotremastrum suecicum HHB10207 ss-3 TaxID=1314776 RepID=A0A165X1N2_9AGAM|nr:hypothetical protein SISSUDRAFT_1067502 [Sistotremastrum suecicum HHB10207 ss-3]
MACIHSREFQEETIVGSSLRRFVDDGSSFKIVTDFLSKEYPHSKLAWDVLNVTIQALEIQGDPTSIATELIARMEETYDVMLSTVEEWDENRNQRIEKEANRRQEGWKSRRTWVDKSEDESEDEHEDEREDEREDEVGDEVENDYEDLLIPAWEKIADLTIDFSHLIFHCFVLQS